MEKSVISLFFSLKIYVLAAIISFAIMELVVLIRRVIRLGNR